MRKVAWLAAVIQLTAVHAAQAEPISSCGSLTASGSYELARDVTASPGEPCFAIRAADVTFDGQGHTITTDGGHAVEIVHSSGSPPSGVDVRNFVSNGTLHLYGDDVGPVTFEEVTAHGFTNYGADDVTVRNCVIGDGGYASANLNEWHALRPQLIDSQITGGSTSLKILVEVRGGESHPCPRIDAVLRGNVITSTRDDEPQEGTAAVRVRCATHTVFEDNQVLAPGTAIALYMRDESDDGRYDNNVFWSNDRETIRIAAGNDDKTWPARNVFRGNVFRSNLQQTMLFQGIGSANQFENNCFRGHLASLISNNDGNVYRHNTFIVGGSGQPIDGRSYEDPAADEWVDNVFSYEGTDVFEIGAWSFARYQGDYNLFHNRGGAVSFGSEGASLDEWQANAAAAGHPSDANSLEADPQFLPIDGGSCCVSDTSPTRGAASDGSDMGTSVCGDGTAGAGGSSAGGGGMGAPGGLGGGGATPPTGASPHPTDTGGCGCATPGRPAGDWASWAALLVLTAAGTGRARRRKWPRHATIAASSPQAALNS